MEYFAVFGSESMEYITIKEAAEKWNLSVRRVQTICNEGMIQGTRKTLAYNMQNNYRKQMMI